MGEIATLQNGGVPQKRRRMDTGGSSCFQQAITQFLGLNEDDLKDETAKYD